MLTHDRIGGKTAGWGARMGAALALLWCCTQKCSRALRSQFKLFQLWPWPPLTFTPMTCLWHSQKRYTQAGEAEGDGGNRLCFRVPLSLSVRWGCQVCEQAGMLVSLAVYVRTRQTQLGARMVSQAKWVTDEMMTSNCPALCLCNCLHNALCSTSRWAKRTFLIMGMQPYVTFTSISFNGKDK